MAVTVESRPPFSAALMSSATVQAKITAFESLAGAAARALPPSTPPPNLGQKTSLIDLRDWVVEDGTRRPVSKPPPEVKPKPKHLVSRPVAPALRSVASTSSLRSPSTSYLYPPRHNDSSNVDRGHTYPPRLNADHRSGHAPASSISSFHSVSLSSDTDPGCSRSELSIKSYGSDTVSLDESYEEVSSTFVGSPATERLINLDWERASAQWKIQPQPPAAAKPPVLPPRSTPSISSSSSTSTLASRRAPPLPSRSSDRSSVLSSATSDSAFSVNYATYQPNHNKAPSQIPAVQINSTNLVQKARRPTPIPPKARKRYEDLFDANVVQRRKAGKRRKDMPALLTPQEARQSRRAVGWRGLSIDLTTAGGHPADSKVEEPVDHVVGNDEVLDGRIVRCIWTRSGLDKKKLHGIWNDCDASKRGVVDREAFVKGMWKIDEELRRALRVAGSLQL